MSFKEYNKCFQVNGFKYVTVLQSVNWRIPQSNFLKISINVFHNIYDCNKGFKNLKNEISCLFESRFSTEWMQGFLKYITGDSYDSLQLYMCIHTCKSLFKQVPYILLVLRHRHAQALYWPNEMMRQCQRPNHLHHSKLLLHQAGDHLLTPPGNICTHHSKKP